MPRFTRREFLEDTLFAAALAATAGAQGTAHAEQAQGGGRKVGPNDQIRIAVLGVNGRGKDHLKGWVEMNDVTVVAICDPDPATFAPAAKIVTAKGKPEPKYVQDLRRIMEDKNIDAVSIATPNHWHSLAGIWAMQTGKDVYVEKPVSHNVREGRVLVDTARKYNRICQAGTQCRSMQGTIDAIDYVKSGKIGKLQVARGLCYKPRPSIGKVGHGALPPGLDYDLWTGPAPMKPLARARLHYDWHWVWDTGNGDLGNQGIHQMDIARWSLGVSGFPKSTMSFGGRLGYEDDGQTPNTQIVVHNYGDALLVFEVRGLKTADYRGARVGNVFHGTDGYVVLTSYTGGAAFDKDGKQVTTFSGAGNHFRNFIDAMRTRDVKSLHGEIEEGHVSSALCHLGNISYLMGEQVSMGTRPKGADANETLHDAWERFGSHLAENGIDTMNAQYRLGKPLALQPGAERFKNAQANELLFAHYRKGYEVPARA